jgi:hypothetical protein
MMGFSSSEMPILLMALAIGGWNIASRLALMFGGAP